MNVQKVEELSLARYGKRIKRQVEEIFVVGPDGSFHLDLAWYYVIETFQERIRSHTSM